MRIEKRKIVTGIAKYIESEVIPAIPDKGFQVVLSIGSNALKTNNSLLDSFLDNNLFKTVSKYSAEDDTYDADAVFKLLKDSIDKVGYFPVKIPAITFISPVEKELKFSSEDVDKLKDYITG